MSNQDEGRIDPSFTEVVSPIGSAPLDEEGRVSGPFTPAPTPIIGCSGGISEFARLEEERAALLEQGVPEQDLLTPKDYTKMTRSDPDYDEAEDMQQACGHTHPLGYEDTVAIGRRVASVIAPGMKDTNPKDGVGSLKPSYSNVPIPVLYEIGAAMLEGSRKYGGYNWRVAGVRVSVYIEAARRHLDSFMEGEDIDPDSGLSHITKAIASLVVLRDAQIQSMVKNDDRPPSTCTPFMRDTQERVTEIIARYPSPVANFTQAEIAHMRNTPVNIFAGTTLGYEVEVMLPADSSDNGYIWTQQGGRRTDLDHTLAVAQALRDDGYGQRVVRITRVSDRVEEMQEGNQYVSGELRAAVVTAFPGDASLMEATEEKAETFEDHQERFAKEHYGKDEAVEGMTDDSIRQEIADNGGGFDQYGNRVEASEAWNAARDAEAREAD